MELWDVYTPDRIKTDLVVKRGEKLPQGLYRIAVLVCLFNDEGKMLIQHRIPDKPKWPNLWDVSAGGSAISGDTSKSAAERELFEELGIRHSFDNPLPSMTITGVECFIDIYTVIKNVNIEKLKLQPDEVDGAMWASEEEIYTLIDNGEFIPYNKGIINAAFFLRNHRGVKWEK